MNNQRLPAGKQSAIVHSVTAKSVARIGIRQTFKAYNRRKRFFCAQHTYPFMAGLLGASKDAPVSLNAGYANPDNSATIPDIGMSHGGSKIQGAPPMAITCRLALIEGNTSRLCTCRVRSYITLSFNSHRQARKEAHRLNAVVCGWNTAPRRAKV